MTRLPVTATTTLDCGVAEIVVEASVTPGTPAAGWDPGDGGEVEITRAWREEGPRAQRVAVDLDALEKVLGQSGWAALEEALFESAIDASYDDPPEADGWRGE